MGILVLVQDRISEKGVKIETSKKKSEKRAKNTKKKIQDQH